MRASSGVRGRDEVIRIPVILGIDVPRPLFLSPKIHITPGARDAIAEAGEDPRELLDRHFCGDWGDLDPEDAAKNDAAVPAKDRVLSLYRTTTGRRIYVITDPGHETTTILLREEY